jgi:hypothetical protein
VTDERLISVSEAARRYRKRRATVRAAVSARKLPGRWSGSPSKIANGIIRPGKTLFVSAKRAEELWGL